MTKKKANTGVAVANQFTQADIPSLLKIINDKIDALKGDKEKESRITGTLGSFGKISDITDVNILRGAYAYISKKAEAINSFNDVFKKASPTTDLPTYKEGGASATAWQEEILTQFKSVVFKEELERLEKSKKILTDNLSVEAKLAESLLEISKLLEVK